MRIVRAIARYWFIAPLILIVISVQLGLGLVIANSTITANTPGAEASDQQQNESSPENRSARAKASSTPSPTSIPTYTPSATPSPTLNPTLTFTPSPTRTATNTPTGTRTPTLTPSPSATPTPAATSSPTLQPTPRFLGTTLTVPILMYHYLSAPPAGADAIRRDLSISPTQFEEHLAYLRQTGYESISMEQLSLALSQQTGLPAKPVIITFDDGYRDNYENAFPLLRKYGYSGTFFIFTQPIDTQNVDYLTWEMVTEMHKAGMEFGSHSHTHPSMSGRDIGFLNAEIQTSKAAIEAHIDEPVRFFAYPSGRYDNLTIQAVQSANFWGAVTTQWGALQSFGTRFEMLRVRVSGNDTADNLASKLRLFEN